MIKPHNVIQAKLEGSDGEVEDKDIPVSFFEEIMEEGIRWA